MKRLTRHRYRLALGAGLPGVRPAQREHGPEDAEERRKLGYQEGWFVVHEQTFGAQTVIIWALGAVGNRECSAAEAGCQVFSYCSPDCLPDDAKQVTTFAYSYEGEDGWGGADEHSPMTTSEFTYDRTEHEEWLTPLAAGIQYVATYSYDGDLLYRQILVNRR